VVKTGNLPKGDDFLPGVSIQKLRQIYRDEKGAKQKLRILIAIHRKEGKSIDDISDFTDIKRRTVHEILRRFIERGIDAKDNRPKSGRPAKLSVKQRQELVSALEQGPPHNRTGLWSTKDVAELIRKRYGVKYTNAHVWELLTVAGFSLQRPRPRHYKTATREEVIHFKKRLQCWRGITGNKGLS
jgi:transposase